MQSLTAEGSVSSSANAQDDGINNKLYGIASNYEESFCASPKSSSFVSSSPVSLSDVSLKRKVDEILEGSLKRSSLYGSHSYQPGSTYAGSPTSSLASPSQLTAETDILGRLLRPCRNGCGATFAYRSSEEDHNNHGKCPVGARVKSPERLPEVRADVGAIAVFDDSPTVSSPLTSPTSIRRLKLGSRKTRSVHIGINSPAAPAASPSRRMRERTSSSKSEPDSARTSYPRAVLRSCIWPRKMKISDDHDTQVIQCDKCKAYLHFLCAGMCENDQRLEPDESFICPPCQQQTVLSETVKYKKASCIRPDCDWRSKGQSAEWSVVERILGRSFTEAGGSNEKVFFWLVKWEGFPHAKMDWQTKESLGAAFEQNVKRFELSAIDEGLDISDKESILLLHDAAKKVEQGNKRGWPWALGLP